MYDEPQPQYTPGRVLPGGRGPVLVLLAVLIAVLAYMAVHNYRLRRPAAEPRPVIARGDLADDEKANIAIFRQASPSVVFLTVTRLARQGPFSLNVLEIPQGAGSGFVWDDQGHIVTNHHVIQGAHRARVTFGDGSSADAELVGDAPERDLAVLRIRNASTQLVPIAMGSSGDLEVGQKVFAIGNPFGFDQTLTTGVISGLGREITTPEQRRIRGVIQTDAAINPGNSGGPLLDSAGRLIGVNTAIISPSGAYAGVGFAVPADTVNQIVPQLIRFGRAARPGLAITCAPLHIQRRLGIRGALVLSVEEGGPADQAGVRPTLIADGVIRLGDIVVAVENKPVTSDRELQNRIDEHDIGDVVTITVARNGRQLDLKVRLQAEFGD